MLVGCELPRAVGEDSELLRHDAMEAARVERRLVAGRILPKARPGPVDGMAEQHDDFRRWDHGFDKVGNKGEEDISRRCIASAGGGIGLLGSLCEVMRIVNLTCARLYRCKQAIVKEVDFFARVQVAFPVAFESVRDAPLKRGREERGERGNHPSTLGCCIRASHRSVVPPFCAPAMKTSYHTSEQ